MMQVELSGHAISTGAEMSRAYSTEVSRPKVRSVSAEMSFGHFCTGSEVSQSVPKCLGSEVSDIQRPVGFENKVKTN